MTIVIEGSLPVYYAVRFEYLTDANIGRIQRIIDNNPNVRTATMKTGSNTTSMICASYNRASIDAIVQMTVRHGIAVETNLPNWEWRETE